MRSVKLSLVGFLLTFLVFSSCKKAPVNQTGSQDPTVEAQTEQIVHEAATGVMDRYEYIPKERLARGYWDASGPWGDRDLLDKHTNLAVQFASRIFKRDTVIQTVVVQTTVEADTIHHTRAKAIEDVIDRKKFLNVHWADLPGKPLMAAYNHAITAHYVDPAMQKRIEGKDIDRDIMYQP